MTLLTLHNPAQPLLIINSIKSQVQLMTKRLSAAFFGDKKLTQKIYDHFLQNNSQLSPQDIHIIFEPYSSKLSNIAARDQDISLFDIFCEFIQGVVGQFADWQFQKFTSVVEIAAHVFEHSFEQWLSKEQSFKYFSDVVVRHSLFRPPHSVCVFNHEQMTEITRFWICHFHRYYQLYQECMSSSLNQILTCHPQPSAPQPQLCLKQAKVIDKATIAGMLQ